MSDRVFVVYDLEATCTDNQPQVFLNEIIEIGATKVINECVTDTFQTFTKPTENPILTTFCTKLTSITQHDVDLADSFENTLDAFNQFVGDSAIFVSWGWYDRKQILREAERKNYTGPLISKLQNFTYLNLKLEVARILQCRPCGMEIALGLLNLPLMGTHHRGIDDAQNITNILLKVLPSVKI